MLATCSPKSRTPPSAIWRDSGPEGLRPHRAQAHAARNWKPKARSPAGQARLRQARRIAGSGRAGNHRPGHRRRIAGAAAGLGQPMTRRRIIIYRTRAEADLRSAAASGCWRGSKRAKATKPGSSGGWAPARIACWASIATARGPGASCRSTARRATNHALDKRDAGRRQEQRTGAGRALGGRASACPRARVIERIGSMTAQDHQPDRDPRPRHSDRISASRHRRSQARRAVRSARPHRSARHSAGHHRSRRRARP